MLAVGDVVSAAGGLPDELVGPCLADAEQHLELVLVAGSAVARDKPRALVDQPLVVRRDPHVGATFEQDAERSEEARADLVEVVVGDPERLHVDPLAEPHVWGQVLQCREVVQRPPEVGLEDDADVVQPFSRNSR